MLTSVLGETAIGRRILQGYKEFLGCRLAAEPSRSHDPHISLAAQSMPKFSGDAEIAPNRS
jgi:hypothetical protein